MITKDDDTCNGAACIGGTRIPVWLLEHYRQAGVSETAMLRVGLEVTKMQVRAALHYASEHQDEMRVDFERNQVQWQEVA